MCPQVERLLCISHLQEIAPLLTPLCHLIYSVREGLSLSCQAQLRGSKTSSWTFLHFPLLCLVPYVL